LVETDEAEVTGGWDDADLEDDRLHKIGEQASRMFLALLERHHLPRGRNGAAREATRRVS